MKSVVTFFGGFVCGLCFVSLMNTGKTGQPNEAVPSFTQLLIESGSDKYDRHHYERYYERWLSPFRHKKNLKVLEIGADEGKSLDLWSNYFTNYDLVLGLAFETTGTMHHVVEAGDRGNSVRVLHGDQSKKRTMIELEKEGPWDIIIDDGSHFPGHVIYTLFELWKTVKPGGIYVIEDLETNYWPNGATVYGYTLRGVGIGAGPEYNAIPKLQQLLEVLVRHQLGAKELSVMPGDGSICSIEWGMNLVSIRKCGDSDGRGPDYLEGGYDHQRMENWITEAKRTNPIVDEEGNFVGP